MGQARNQYEAGNKLLVGFLLSLLLNPEDGGDYVFPKL
jgi:hypothetical protein